ncbi:hypothetical protein HR45_10885 [Shewanella mangrovi]|uniref:DUF4382 domain-containing protein n=1 Tax=Shewanella mangrovi TaxID=1515746 RepID=A0A094JC74_9GAMM|nr:DUF4382 domain-containing protein [Shewanella mangrovi]KFZ37505.1 hypothetical protein HR45_10885 [Shewanella mangrovi]
MKLFQYAFLFSAISAVTACGGSSDTVDTKEQQAGLISIALSDSPMAGVSAVQLQLGQLMMTDANNVEHSYSLNNMTINMLDYQGKASINVVDSLQIPAGQYHNVYMTVVQGDGNNGCYVDDGQGRHALTVEDGVLPMQNFTMLNAENHTYTMEVNLYQGLHYGQQYGYQLAQDGLRTVNNLHMGHMLGDVDPQWIASCEAANPDAVAANGSFIHLAYIYPAASVTDISQMGDVYASPAAGMTAPMAVAPIHLDDDGNWYFGMGYLPEGEYRVGYSCSGNLDDPLTDDTSSGQFNMFADAGTVTIVAGATGGTDTYVQCGMMGTGNGHWGGMGMGMGGG